MLDDAAVLLGDPGQKAGYVHEGDDGQVEAVTEPDEPGGLERGVDVEDARQHRGLVGHDPDRPPPEPGEADHDVVRVAPVHLEEARRRPPPGR